MTSGMVMIYSLDSTNAQPYSATMVVDSMGIYSFSYVPLGNYVVWAIPYDSTGYLPTYYGDVLYWQQATVITIGQPQNPYNIHMIPVSGSNGGSGGINGHINGKKSTSSLSDKMYMILMNEQGNAIRSDHVNASGDFTFGVLEFGVYFLHVELPGCTSDLVRVELTAGNPVAMIVMTFSGNNFMGVSDHAGILENMIMYPNPVIDVMHLHISVNKDTRGTILLTDLTGKIVISEQHSLLNGTNSVEINISILNQGIYLMKVSSADGMILTRKVVKTN